MRNWLTGILVFVSVVLNAQVAVYDALTFGGRDLLGTTRYVGMGGAMAAVGGDPSAASDNPAGLGVYRRNEISLTLDEQFGQNSFGQKHSKFSCGQASWNFCFLQDRMKGVVANNLMLNYRRLKNFRREYSTSLANMDYSQTDVIAMKTDGLPESALQGEDAWYDSEVGWLSKLGYEGYLIDPDSTGENLWMAANTGTVDGSLKVSEYGATDEFTIGWGMNISNSWYVGLEMGVRSLTYSKSTYYSELFTDAKYQLNSYVNMSGVGFVSKIGLMGRPTQWLRLGVAFHSPVPMAITLRNNATLTTAVQGLRNSFSSKEEVYSSDQFTQPMRVVVGTAFQLGRRGMLSLQYDYSHDLHKGTPDVHWAKVGGEIVVANNWFFNLGYALQFNTLTNGKWSDPVFTMDYNSVRFDTERCNLLHAQYLSAGFAFRHRYVVVGLAYQCRLMQEALRFHEFQLDAQTLASTTHKIVLTLALRR